MHNLLHDLAALTKQEMVLWDWWGLAERTELSAEELAVLDQVAQSMVSDRATIDDLRRLAGRAELAVPSEVTSYSPAMDTPVRVPAVR